MIWRSNWSSWRASPLVVGIQTLADDGRLKSIIHSTFLYRSTTITQTLRIMMTRSGQQQQQQQ